MWGLTVILWPPQRKCGPLAETSALPMTAPFGLCHSSSISYRLSCRIPNLRNFPGFLPFYYYFLADKSYPTGPYPTLPHPPPHSSGHKPPYSVSPSPSPSYWWVQLDQISRAPLFFLLVVFMAGARWRCDRWPAGAGIPPGVGSGLVTIHALLRLYPGKNARWRVPAWADFKGTAVANPGSHGDAKY